MLIAAIVLGAITLVSFPATQYLRNVVGDRRERRGELNSTQDIMMWMTLVWFLLFIANAVCLYFAAAELRERVRERERSSLLHPEYRVSKC